MSIRYKLKRRQRYYRTCDVAGCKEHARPCRLSMWEKPEETLCFKHAREAGYCPGCGIFWAGVTSFDLSRTGYCDNCDHQIRTDMGEFDEVDEHCDYEDREYCNTCGNSGMLICYCGGDLCCCENNGEYPCPDCG